MEVLDLFATYELKRWSKLWVGQFKSMLSRSYLGSSSALLFSERPLAVRTFVDSPFQEAPTARLDRLQGHGGGRLPRLRLTNYWYFGHGDRSGDELGIRLRAEVSRGTRSFEASGGTAYTFRIEVHPDGNPGYTEGNLRAERQGRLSFDLAYHVDPGQAFADLDGDGLLGEEDRMARRVTNLGWVYRRGRFSSQGEYFRQRERPRSAWLSRPEVESRGHYALLGWTWVPLRWEMGLRYSQVDPDAAVARDRRHEKAVSLTRYFDEEVTKAVLEVVETSDARRPGQGDRAVRLQYQVTF